MAEIRARAHRSSRRRSLVDAATEVFRAKGVDASTVDDIVGQARVAKGTFYLYFRTKDDVVDAVADQVVARVAERVEAAVATPGTSPVDQLRALGTAMLEVGGEPYERELVELFHRPGNRAVHDRTSERVVARLAPVLATIIADGMGTGTFVEQDPARAAAFVMASYGALHDLVATAADLPDATADLERFVLRGLGFRAEARG